MHRSNRVHLLLGVLFVLILALVWIWEQRIDERYKIWVSCATLAYGCVAGFLIWMRSLRYSRLVDDIPTSKVETAAQGYVELCGRAAQHDDQRAKSLIGTPVLWYRKEYANRFEDNSMRTFPFNLFYVPTETEESETPFSINDGTGIACILPYGAEIICKRRQIRHSDNQRVIEEQILPGDPLYVIGDFSSHTRQVDLDQAAYDLVRQWERNPARRRIYDTDGDGKLNQKEWLAMHDAARINVIEEDLRLNPPTAKHLVILPEDGRPFIISTVSPAELAGRYYFYLFVGFILFIGSGATLAIMIFGFLVD